MRSAAISRNPTKPSTRDAREPNKNPTYLFLVSAAIWQRREIRIFHERNVVELCDTLLVILYICLSRGA